MAAAAADAGGGVAPRGVGVHNVENRGPARGFGDISVWEALIVAVAATGRAVR